MKVHFRFFVFGFCVIGTDVSPQQQGEIEGAFGVLETYIPPLQNFVKIQFSAPGNTTRVTLQDVPTPNSPLMNTPPSNPSS